VLLAGDNERALLLDQLDLLRREAGDGHGDAVLVLVQLLDVVGWPVGLIGSTVAWSSMSKRRSNPTVDRDKGEKSYLIATSSLEQHGV
jgi:hypothetical protein